MAEPLTKKELDKGLEKLAQTFKGEFNRIDKRFDGIDKRLDGVDMQIDSLKLEMNKKFKAIDDKFDRFINMLDKYVKKVEEWQEESKILAARIERMKKVLIKKGIATEKELNLT
ncbi:MAG: hypothetical protein ABIE68_05025 [bacterium]